MPPTAHEPENELIEYLEALWKRRWLVILPSFALAVLAGVASFLLPTQWDVDIIIQPSKFFVQTEQGTYVEVVITDPRQIAGQINQESYNRLIGAELNLDPRKFPKLRAENLRDTKLVRVTVKTGETDKAKAILSSLFLHLKSELDRKIDVEIKGLTTQITAKEHDIKARELDIQVGEIEIEKTKREIVALANKLKISEARARDLAEEMTGVKGRIDEIERQQKSALAEKQEGGEAIGLLLYANEIQQSYRYLNTLDESLSRERARQEDLRLSGYDKEQEIKSLRTKMEKVRQGILGLKGDIDLLEQKKQRIDFAQLVKEPTVSLYPVSPRKKVNAMLAGLGGLFFMMSVVLGLEYIRRSKLPR